MRRDDVRAARSRVAQALDRYGVLRLAGWCPLVCMTGSVNAKLCRLSSALRISARTVPARCPGRLPGIGPDGPAALPVHCSPIFLCCGIRPGCRWYGPVVPKSPILPLAAAVTAVALGAAPAQAAPLSPGKRDGATVVAFPLLAVKGQAPASVGCHVSHSSHHRMCRARVAGTSLMSRTCRMSRRSLPRRRRARRLSRPSRPRRRARPRPPARARAGRLPPGRRRAACRAARRIWGAAARPRAMAGAARSSLSRRSAPSWAGSGGSPAEGGRDEPGGRRAWRWC